MINRRHLIGISATAVLSPAVIGGAAGAQAWPTRFSLDQYEMQRDPDETDEEFEVRLNFFR